MAQVVVGARLDREFKLAHPAAGTEGMMAVFSIMGLILAVLAISMNMTVFLVNRHRKRRTAAWLKWQEEEKDPFEYFKQPARERR